MAVSTHLCRERERAYHRSMLAACLACASHPSSYAVAVHTARAHRESWAVARPRGAFLSGCLDRRHSLGDPKTGCAHFQSVAASQRVGKHVALLARASARPARWARVSRAASPVSGLEWTSVLNLVLIAHVQTHPSTRCPRGWRARAYTGVGAASIERVGAPGAMGCRCQESRGGCAGRAGALKRE